MLYKKNAVALLLLLLVAVFATGLVSGHAEEISSETEPPMMAYEEPVAEAPVIETPTVETPAEEPATEPPVVVEEPTPAPPVVNPPVEEETEDKTDPKPEEKEDPKPEETEKPGTKPPTPAKVHTVRYLDYDGTVFMTAQVISGESISEPDTAPVKPDHEFVYWYDSKAGAKTPYQFGEAVTANMTLRAFFKPIEIEEEASEDEEAEEEAPEEEAEEAEEPAEPIALPYATLEYFYESETLRPGDAVTLYATLHDMAEGFDITIQWQNDATGEFCDVEGATGQVYAFEATEENTSCQWRARLYITVLDTTQQGK